MEQFSVGHTIVLCRVRRLNLSPVWKINNLIIIGWCRECYLSRGWLPAFGGDGVIVGSLELGLSQHHPCMPEWKDEAVGPSCDDRWYLVFWYQWLHSLFVTGKPFVWSLVHDPTPPGLDSVLVVLPLFAYAMFYCDAMLSSSLDYHE